MGSFFPSTPASAPQNTEQIPPTSLMQLAMAVRQQKQAEATQQKSEAAGRLDMLLKNPIMMQMMDPKMIEKDFSILGYKLGSPESIAAAQGEGGGGPSPASPQPQIPTAQIAKVGAAAQGNAAGAQAASPPSPEAARQAPGGGVQPGGIVTPGTGQIDALKKQAEDGYAQKFGALAPLYQGAELQRRADLLKQQHQAEVDQVASDAAKGDPRAMGRLMMLSGHPITDADMRGMIFSSSNTVNDKTRSQALDFALGNETPADRAKRFADIYKTTLSSKELMSSLSDPSDAARFAQSVADGNGVPSDIRMQMPLDEIIESNKFLNDLMATGGLSLRDAMMVADLRAKGFPYSQSLPAAAHGLTIPQEKAQTEATAASGAYLSGVGAEARGEGERLKYTADANKIMTELDKDPEFSRRVTQLINMARYKVPIPSELMLSIQDELASRSGLTKEAVTNFWNYTVDPFNVFGTKWGTKYVGKPSGALDNEGKPSEQGSDPYGYLRGSTSSTTDQEKKSIQDMSQFLRR